MENDIVLFRYADALLMKSEAKVRNGANGDEELNEVRSRVNASPPHCHFREYPCRTSAGTGLGRMETTGLSPLREVYKSLQQPSATTG